jgi:hypothetical protein
MNKSLYLLITFVVLISTHLNAISASIQLVSDWKLQDLSKTPNPPSAVSQPGFDTKNWIQATVPGTVLSSLINNRIYPDPLYGVNNYFIPESLNKTSYWYRTEFTVPVNPSSSNSRIWLHMEGINYIADVWVNGKSLGKVEGAFARGIFDMTTAVQPGKKGSLAILVSPPPHPGNAHRLTLENRGKLPNGGPLTQDNPTFVCTAGWDWIKTIPDRDTGIWNRVYIDTTGPVSIEDPYVTSAIPLPSTATADLTLQVTLNNTSNETKNGNLIGVYDGHRFCYPVKLNPNSDRVLTLTSKEIPQLHVTSPRLWWPNGYGAQNLYGMQLCFSCDHVLSDIQTVRFGIRKLSYFVKNSSNLTISVNGQPIMIKGGDWGMDEALKRVPKERLEAQMRFQKEAGYNMIRNWVGQSTSEPFFELCDQMGLLVWDEFFYTSSEGPPPLNHQRWLDNVTDTVLRYRHHPSIAVWCGGNEGAPPVELDQGAKKIVATLDPDRHYQSSSGDENGVASGGPYDWQNPEAYFENTASPGVQPFKDEIGSDSIPTLESVQSMMPKPDWESVNDDWMEHNFRLDFYNNISSRYGQFENLADFVRKGQLANYEAYRAIYESRFAHMFKPCTAILIWMSNSIQPCFVWNLYSYDLEPNSSFFATKKACEPIHIQFDANNVHISVINHTLRQLGSAKIIATWINSDGSKKTSQTFSTNVLANSATDAGSARLPASLSPLYFLKLQLFDSANRLLSSNFYWHSTKNTTGFQGLNQLKPVELKGQVNSNPCEKDRLKLTVCLSNPTPYVALMAHIQLRTSKTNQRVLPAYYDDNYISLLPCETRTLYVDVSKKDLKGESPKIVLDGWNTTVRQTGVSSIPIATNRNALPGSWPKTNLPIVEGVPSLKTGSALRM